MHKHVPGNEIAIFSDGGAVCGEFIVLRGEPVYRYIYIFHPKKDF
jgi:hypothetical protein